MAPQDGLLVAVGSHLEEGSRLCVEVQDRLGRVPRVLSSVELVADLDADVGEVVLL